MFIGLRLALFVDLLVSLDSLSPVVIPVGLYKYGSCYITSQMFMVYVGMGHMLAALRASQYLNHEPCRPD